MKRRHKRLTFAAVGMVLVVAAAALVLIAFEDSIVFFHSPTDVLAKNPPPDQRLRVGGLVEEGSVEKPGGAVVTFRITDLINTLPVTYRGMLPDLFREGQGVIAEGFVKDGVFHADEVLAKHDETYMPPEVADALKKSGKWDEMGQKMKEKASP